MTEIEQKAIKEMEAMLEEHFIANNHSNCDVGYSYSEIHFCKERDIKGVAHSIGTALVKAGYRKQEDTVKEFANIVISECEHLQEHCEEMNNNAAYDYVEILIAEINSQTEQYGKEIEK